MGPRAIITSLGAVMDEKSAAGHRLRAAAASLGGAKLASIDFDDEEDDLDESSVASAGQTSDDASDSELASAGIPARRPLITVRRRGSRADRSDASSSHRHSRSRSKRSRRDASSRGWKSEDAAYLTPRDIKKRPRRRRASLRRISSNPSEAARVGAEEAYQRWSRLKPEDAVEAPSDVGSYRDVDSTRVSSSKTTSSSASSAKSGAARRSSSSSASSSRGARGGLMRTRRRRRRRRRASRRPRWSRATRPPTGRSSSHRSASSAWVASSSSPSFSFVIDARGRSARERRSAPRRRETLRPGRAPARLELEPPRVIRERGRPPRASLRPSPAGWTPPSRPPSRPPR